MQKIDMLVDFEALIKGEIDKLKLIIFLKTLHSE